MVRHDKCFQIVTMIFLTLVALFCIIPIVLLVSSSFSNEGRIIHEGYSLVPRQFDLTAYKYVLNGSNGILRAYLISAIVTVVGTVLSLTITLLYAYPISRADLKGRNFFSFLLFFTILFNGGFIPTYMMWTQTFHIKNTFYAYLLPNLLMSGFYTIMARNFFASSIPMATIESAKIDGAGEFRTFVAIVLPLSTPIIATLGLFVALNYWNDWQNGLYYITKDNMYSVQVLLNRMLLDALYAQQGLTKNLGSSIGAAHPSNTLKMSIAVLGAVPVFLVFPFAAKYLTGGIIVGAVKG